MLRRHPVLAPLTLAYLLGVAWITLGPQPLDGREQHWLASLLRAARAAVAPHWPSLAGELSYAHAEFCANIAMFVPIGVFLLLLLGRRLWWLALLAGVALTGAIETAQRFIPGRVADIRDIEANSLGAALGVLVALLLTVPAYRRERDRRRIAQLETELAHYRGEA